MQIKNNYQLEWEICTRFGLTVDKGMGVFNGDMGVISEINEYKETVEVEYDEGRKVKYGFDMVDELELAYAITVHKSQGSEYPAVILPLLPGPIRGGSWPRSRQSGVPRDRHSMCGCSSRDRCRRWACPAIR